MALDGVELRHLQALRAIAAEGSFGAAARRLGFTQSAISQQIAALERAVGAPVFDRPGGPRPVTLTPAGRTLLRHADAMVDRLAQAERELDDLFAGRTDHLRVGTFQSVSVKLLPSIVQRLRDARPGVEISLFEHDDIRLLVDGLLRDDLDVAFLVGPYVDARLQCEWLCHDRFVVISAAPAPDAPIGPDALSGASLVGMPPTPCQAIIDDGLRAHGVEPRFVFRSGDNGAIQAMVRAGMGDAVMPYLAIDAADPGIVVRELDPPIPPRVVGLAQRVGVTLSPAAEYFVELARTVCRDVDTVRV